uniref:Ymf74 n=1 Tax=Tetrahymena malaccensis TaxID=5901 RepID=Q09FB9_TETMA|nr:Ymf74 [Tetrahymena malaccensis]ABI51632.1 Ymf74 [Tetrahymena malaccensis]
MKFKREFKFLIKKKNFKFKKFKLLLKIYYSIKNLIKYYKIIKLNNSMIKSKLLIKTYSYFNFLTNGLDLKYENLYQDFNTNNLIFKHYKIKNLIITDKNNLSIIKFQQFLNIIDNKYINEFNEDSLLDIFYINLFLYYNLILEFYKNLINTQLLKIN